MATKLIQTKKTTLSYGINDSATAMRLVNLVKLNGSSMSASDIGDLLYGTFDPGTSREEIFSIDGANVTVNGDGSVDITGVVRGLKEVSPYNAGGYATDHPAGAIVIFGNNPQLFLTFASILNDNNFEGENNFELLPTSDGGDATEDEQLITYRQALELATGTASINRVVVAGNGGETITAGQLIYLDVADGEWKKCDADTADSVNNIILGLAQGAGTDGTPILNGVLLFGLDSNQTGLTTNTPYYASNTAGGISTTPGTTEVSVGVSRSTTSILFYPRYNQQLTEDQQDALLGDVGTPSATNLFVTQKGFQAGSELFIADASGSSTAYTATLAPAIAAYTDGMVVRVKIGLANTTTTPTLAVNGLTARTIVKLAGTALALGDIAAGMYCIFQYDLANTRWIMFNPVNNVFALQSMKSITPRPSAPALTGALVSATFSSNTTMYLYQFILPADITVNKITVQTNATVTTPGTIDLSVYSEDGQTLELSVTTASISAGNTPVTTAVGAVTLRAGVHYLAINTNGTTSTTLDCYVLGTASLFDDGVPTGEPLTEGSVTISAGTPPSTFDPTTLSASTARSVIFRLDN